MLCSRTYYTQQGFRGLYGQSWYEGPQRGKYGAMTLPTLYGKLHVDVGKAKGRKNEVKRSWMGQLKGVWPIPRLVVVLCIVRGQGLFDPSTAMLEASERGGGGVARRTREGDRRREQNFELIPI